jgi:hypothetical protein
MKCFQFVVKWAMTLPPMTEHTCLIDLEEFYFTAPRKRKGVLTETIKSL